MAREYLAFGGERLYELSTGDADDFMQEFARENGGTDWRGQGVLEPNEHVRIPETITNFQYSDEEIPSVKAAKDILDHVPDTMHVRPAQIYVDPTTGNSITLDDAIPYEVINRLLTYRPQRWMRPNYGSRLMDMFDYFITPDLLNDIRRVIEITQAPAAPRYELVDTRVEAENNKIYITIFTTREIQFVISPTGLEVNLL